METEIGRERKIIRFLADENVDGYLLQGCVVYWPSLDIVRAQDIGLAGMTDESVLEYAAAANRVLISQDHQTMIKFAKDRIAKGIPMAGLLVIRPKSIRQLVIEEIGNLAECMEQQEWEGLIEHVPF